LSDITTKLCFLFHFEKVVCRETKMLKVKCMKSKRVLKVSVHELKSAPKH